LGGAFDGGGDFFRGDTIAAESAQTDGRHPGAGTESSLGNQCGVDRSCIHENETNIYGNADNGKNLRLYR
jgi:hypothetical protein